MLKLRPKKGPVWLGFRTATVLQGYDGIPQQWIILHHLLMNFRCLTNSIFNCVSCFYHQLLLSLVLLLYSYTGCVFFIWKRFQLYLPTVLIMIMNLLQFFKTGHFRPLDRLTQGVKIWHGTYIHHTMTAYKISSVQVVWFHSQRGGGQVCPLREPVIRDLYR